MRNYYRSWRISMSMRRERKKSWRKYRQRLDLAESGRRALRQRISVSESRTISPRRQRRSRSPRHNPSVFTRLRRERSRSPRHDTRVKENQREDRVQKNRKERGVRRYIRATPIRRSGKLNGSLLKKDFHTKYKSESGNVLKEHGRHENPLRIRTSASQHPELTKDFTRNIPKTVERNDAGCPRLSLLKERHAGLKSRKEESSSGGDTRKGCHIEAEFQKKGGGAFRCQQRRKNKTRQRSLDIFAWTPTDMTGVPRQVAEHKLNVRKVLAMLGESGIMRDSYMIRLSNPEGDGYQESDNELGQKPEGKGQDDSVREEEPLPAWWTLFTDESSCIDGCGAGVILTDPEGVKFTYALRFKFETTNNEAEYEALIAGLRIAGKMGVKNLDVNVGLKIGSKNNGDTPFSLTYGTEAVIPAEIGMPTFRTAEVDVAENDEALEINLDLDRRKRGAKNN
ncbi:reverse transcriptase domain-containing protein [Tanacetum coccineum]|uniref:Reverse transcriptase domain-containing protein n=1 Tax=Tanacetum coccineum TaxID=301880 RepID=A0ABQ4XYG5_9ASTR